MNKNITPGAGLSIRHNVLLFSTLPSRHNEELIAEASKMLQVRDEYILSLYALCLDGEDMCGLVLPFMKYGSLQQ